MTRLQDHDPDTPEQPSRRRRAVFLAFLLIASSLVYAELIMRFSS